VRGIAGRPWGAIVVMLAPMRTVLLAPFVALGWLAACLPDNPDAPLAEAGEAGETGDSGAEPRVETGLLGCPADEACTIVAVSQTIDDRVELFTAAGPGPVYRGALDLDLKPNPNGDISGENLDEPYGLAWDGAALYVLVGHYPSQEFGSLLRFGAAALADSADGAMVASGEWFAGGASTRPGISLTPLERTEPISLVVDPGSGALLIATFANDLLLPDVNWTEPSELLRIADPSDLGALGSGSAPEIEAAALGCAGAWSVVALDEDAETVAIACDGDESVVLAASDPIGPEYGPRCVADIPFMDKRVRYLAPDGLGGVIVGEAPPIISANEDARIWWFDGNCQLRGFTVLDGATSWELRDLVLVPSAAGPRWLLARADTDDRGVVILTGDVEAGTVSPCGRIDALDQAGAWTALGGTAPLRPHGLALTRDGLGLAVGVGPNSYPNAGPGYGTIWWVELDASEDACDRAALEVVELSSAAPAVDPNIPLTWRRAPDVVHLIEVDP
jgi:hypothetical protein